MKKFVHFVLMTALTVGAVVSWDRARRAEENCQRLEWEAVGGGLAWVEGVRHRLLPCGVGRHRRRLHGCVLRRFGNTLVATPWPTPCRTPGATATTSSPTAAGRGRTSGAAGWWTWC